jgi:L-seryl-tRNA(Ser) seleniumtransferase
VARSAGSRAHDPDRPESAASGEAAARLRELPSVEELAAELDGVPHAVAVRAARKAIGRARESIVAADGGGKPVVLPALKREADELAAAMARPRLRSVINATGVIVHTNLGRAPLSDEAIEAVASVARGYSNLEYDLDAGRRGSRQDHLEDALCELTGAEAAICVNNCAAAVLLAAAALAAGREVVVSRGQLVEIGGSFRIPEVVAQSGARLREVGTTNRTRLSDYEKAIGEQAGAILRAHPSNFRTVGFTEDVAIEALCELGAAAGVPVIDDAGSGALAGGIPELADEPSIARSVRAGCALVCFSGDKLLGGPQAGLIVGRRDAVESCRRHPLARALRPDKLQLAALEATLAVYKDPAAAAERIPVLRMLTASEGELRGRAQAMRDRVAGAGIRAEVMTAQARVGGGALPLLELPGPACAVEPGERGLDDLARRLRTSEPPVIARGREGRLLLDPRTLSEGEAERAAQAVVEALSHHS